MTLDSIGNVPAGAPIVYGVFWGTTADDLTLNDGPLGTASATTAGLIAAEGDPLYRIVGTYAGQTVYMKIAGWDAAFGRDWLSAMRNSGSYYGETDVRPITLGPAAGPGTVIWQPASGVSPNRFRPLTLFAVPYMTSMYLANPSYSVSENSDQVEVVIRRQGDLAEPTAVEWFTSDSTALAGLDYIASTGTVTFAVGESEKVVTIPILNDRIAEVMETFFVQLRNPTGGSGLSQPSKAAIRIQDNDLGIYIESPSYAANEDDPAVEVILRHGDVIPSPVSVEWSTVDGTAIAGQDYIAITGTVTFAAGEVQKTVRIFLRNDGWPERKESFSLQLSNPSGGAILGLTNQANIQIEDNDRGLFIEGPPFAVAENAGMVQIAIRREADVLEPVSVEWFTTNGTARAGEDYVLSSGSVNFGAGEVAKTVGVPILNDGRPEVSESFRVRLANPSGSGGLGVPDEASIQIYDNDRGLFINGAAFTRTENVGSLEIVVRRDADVLEPVSIEWFTTNGTARAGEDYLGSGGLLSFGAGEIEKIVVIPILNDSASEDDEYFGVLLANPSGNVGLGVPREATITIVDDDPAPIRYVWQDSPNPRPPYATWDTAAHEIQEAVNAALSGQTVLVTNGVYQTGAGLSDRRVGLTKPVVVRSVNGPSVTTIDGSAEMGCAYVGSNAMLTGFVLTNGRANSGGGVEADVSGVVSNCFIVGNVALFGGGGASGGIFFNCFFTGNTADWGGGAAESALFNSALSGNRAREGGGTVRSTLHNCTVTDNRADERGGGAFGGTLHNCIVYLNRSPQGTNYIGDEWSPVIFEFSCTTPLPPGPGNIETDPLLASLTHLSADSPCVGAGSDAFARGLDIDGDEWGFPPGMGADELIPGAVLGPVVPSISATYTNVAPHFPVQFTANIFGRLTQSIWDFGDGTRVTNQPVISHAWKLAGTFVVRLTGYNESHPEGISTTLTVAVMNVTHYVNRGSASPLPPYTNWATAAATIQDALDVVWVPGSLVLVTNGVYDTGAGQNDSRISVTNPVIVKSVNGPEVTTIVGSSDWEVGVLRCAYVGSEATLSGFTLTNGYAGTGAGVWCEGMGLVTNCTLIANSASGGGSGGGAAGGTLYNCTLTGNRAPGARWIVGVGGGAYRARLYNCTLSDNEAGDGAGASESTLYNCVVSRNSGIGVSKSILYNSTITRNSGIGVQQSTLYNCIVYFNSASAGANYDLPFGSTFHYSCTTPLPPGPGNIDADPLLLTDWKLSTGSPCLGAGSLAYASGFDMDGEPWSNPPSMGADESSAGPVAVSISVAETNFTVAHPAKFDARVFGRASQIVWDFGDGTRLTNQAPATHAWEMPGIYTVTLTGFDDTHPDGVSATVQVEVTGTVRYVNVANASPVPPYTSWATAAASIQDAINAGSPVGQVVLVTNGVYRDGGAEANGANRISLPPGTIVRSINGPGVTIIDGAGEMRCAYLGSETILRGFTLTNGLGGGVFAEKSAAVNECIIAGNMDWGSFGGMLRNSILSANSGGAFQSSLINCVVSANAGVGVDNSTLLSCVISGNSGVGALSSVLNNCTLSTNSGGGARGCALNNCMVSGNAAIGDGIGSAVDQSTLYKCTLTGNLGGGADACTLYLCTVSANPDYGAWSCTLHDSLVTGNSNGGVWSSTLYNCTLAGNAGGGAISSTLYNCIAYHNTGWDPVNPNHDNSTFEYSCTTPLPTEGVGNIDADPRFVNAMAGDFRLLPDSPCIDAGTNLAALLTTDLDGLRRPLDGNGDGVARFDMGAYEFNPYRFAPALQFSPDGFRFTVRGEPGKSVRIERSRDLVHWEFAGQVPIPASGQTLIDPVATTERQLFYRVVSVP